MKRILALFTIACYFGLSNQTKAMHEVYDYKGEIKFITAAYNNDTEVVKEMLQDPTKNGIFTRENRVI